MTHVTPTQKVRLVYLDADGVPVVVRDQESETEQFPGDVADELPDE